MKREIKFRGFFDGKMYYPDATQEYANVIFHCFSEYAKTEKDRLECSIMQWTGLKDKEGRDIYESDIVKVYDQEVRVVSFKHAFWLLEEYLWNNVLGGFGTEMESGHKPIYRYPSNQIEVIGNIYETEK